MGFGPVEASRKVLARAGLLQGKRATSYPGAFAPESVPGLEYVDQAVVTDGKVITSRGPGTAMDFALELIETLEAAGPFGAGASAPRFAFPAQGIRFTKPVVYRWVDRARGERQRDEQHDRQQERLPGQAAFDAHRQGAELHGGGHLPVREGVDRREVGFEMARVVVGAWRDVAPSHFAANSQRAFLPGLLPSTTLHDYANDDSDYLA